MDAGRFSISEFARFSRVTRDTLLHYDRIGLLSPAVRSGSGYRYYTGGQLAIINVIRTLQQLGMTLEEIKELKDRRTPELTDEVLGRQIDKIEKRIEDWVRAKKLLFTVRKTIQSVMDIDEDAITIQYLPAEAIVVGDLNDFSSGKGYYDPLLSFYHATSEKYPQLDLNYYVWGIFSSDRLKRGDWVGPDRFYLYNPEGNDRKPAALYATGYTRGKYGGAGKLFEKMMGYIDRNGFEVCGNAYEEYPLNEVCIVDEEEYLIKVMITVREKGGNP